MKPLLTFVACALLLNACRTNLREVDKLRTGMSRDEVVAILGKPITATVPAAGVEVLRFELNRTRMHGVKVPEETQYLVQLRDGKVESFGTERDLQIYQPPRQQ